MPEATQPVKHMDYSSAARENGTFSHLHFDEGPSTLMLEVGSVFQCTYGYFTLTCFHRHGWVGLNSNKIEIEVKQLLGESVFLLFFCRQDSSNSYITITENDAHAIILTFNCDIKDDLNVLGYNKKEVIATGSDQGSPWQELTMQIFEDELMQSQRNYNAVLHAAHLLLKSHPSAAEMFACSLGKTPNTVRNELNPNLPNYKLGLIDAVEMMNCTECFSLLFQINAMCGFVAVPVDLSEKPTERVLDKFCQWQAAVGRTCQSIYDAIEDDIITPSELNAITSAGNKKMAQWFGVQVALQQEAERNHVSRT